WIGMAALAVTALASNASAQTQAQQQAAPAAGPSVGSIAPDFSLPGATRYGLLKGPVHLADYRGETVVLAFFYQARTKG
ncbi:MAG: hypothetical protein ACR2M1_01805, partial [Gemmatimonadaceae bacterium]